jgi:SAM-dependent methyltransferase
MPMSSLSVPYILGGTLSERQRLITQARGREAHARSMLDQIPIGAGDRVVDVGCGPIGILNLLSERVGADGVVVGVEREPRFAEMARTEVAQSDLRNVQVINADALSTGLEKNSFDFVHERLVLINVPAATQQGILAEMFSLVRPGGTIALQEYDAVSYACYPEHPSWKILLGLYNDTFHAAGGNEFVGRSVGSLLRSIGAQNVEIRAHVELPKVGEYQRTHLLSLIEVMRDQILASGRIGEVELRDRMSALVEHLSDPATTLLDKLIVQAWGRKPS